MFRRESNKEFTFVWAKLDDLSLHLGLYTEKFFPDADTIVSQWVYKQVKGDSLNSQFAVISSSLQ